MQLSTLHVPCHGSTRYPRTMSGQSMDDCDCNGMIEVELVYALGATAGLFLVLTIVCSLVIVSLLWRNGRHRNREKPERG